MTATAAELLEILSVYPETQTIGDVTAVLRAVASHTPSAEPAPEEPATTP